MKFRVLASSLVFLFCFACGSKSGSPGLCGTNQQIMSNVTSTCTGVVQGSTSGGNSSGANSNGSNSTSGGTPTASTNGNNVNPGSAGGVGSGNLPAYITDGSIGNPFNPDGDGYSFNSNSDDQAAIDDYLKNGGELPAKLHIPIFAVGAGEHEGGTVQVWTWNNNKPDKKIYDQTAFGAPEIAVRVALCDLHGADNHKPDGTADLVEAAGPGGGPIVRIIDGRTGVQVNQVMAYEETLRTGHFIACADVDRDGVADVLITADVGGGPRMQIFSGAILAAGSDANAAKIYDNFVPDFPTDDRGGLTVAVADVDNEADAHGDKWPEIIIGHASIDASFGVYKWAGSGQQLVPLFHRVNSTLGTNGVRVAAGDVNGDGNADIMLGSALGPNASVMVLSGADGATMLGNWQPYGGGVGYYLAAGFLQRNGAANVMVGAANLGGPALTAYVWSGLQAIWTDFMFDSSKRGGATVAIGLAR